MQPGGKRKDEDAETDASPFVGIRKNVVVREARQYFNEQQINPNKCALVLTKILYLLIQGETFTSEEATEVFFAVTKLFQSPDQHLRRMIYVVIKDLKIGSDESLIVVSCLSKDMTSKTDLFRANSIRVLAKIMDAPMVSQVERFLKQAIVDKNPFIVASTLCAGQHLFPLTPDVIKRWTNEVQEALQSKHKMVQYHALATLYKIKQQDKLALTKVVTALVRNPPQGPMAQCLQIRIIASLLEGSPNNPQPELFKFMIDSLQNKNFMVMYESARNICRMESLTAVQVAPAIGVLQEFLSSPIPAQRFAAVRTLSEVVVRFPLIVTPCSVDLEHLITDNNRSIATLAITTLLKTGVESNVDRLMKSISGFMSDISDEFKIVLVDAIKTLCLKFPHKHQTLMNFLASALREEGGYKYKKSIVESMLTIINEIKDTKDTGKDAMDSGLEHFCEFIEDCIVSGTPVNMSGGTSKPIEQVRVGDYVLSRGINGIVSKQVTAVVDRGVKECVELLFSDGRTLICTPNHRILREDGEWVRAENLIIDTDWVKAGIEYPLDNNAGTGTGTGTGTDTDTDGIWSIDLTSTLGYLLNMENYRQHSMAYARLLGYLLTDGTVPDNTNSGALLLGHKLDATAVQADIHMLTNKTPSLTPDGRIIKITLPKNLHAALLCSGINTGSRVDDITHLPDFVLDDACPLPIVREFLGGLFGGDGTTIALAHENGGILAGLGFCTVRKGHVVRQQANILLHEITTLLSRVGVNIDDCSMCIKTVKPTTLTLHGNQKLQNMKNNNLQLSHVIAESSQVNDNDSYEIFIKLGNGAIPTFIKYVGFRYCVHKQMRLTAANTFYRNANYKLIQKKMIIEMVNNARSHYNKEETGRNLSLAKALVLAKKELQQMQVLLPSVKNWNPTRDTELSATQLRNCGELAVKAYLNLHDCDQFFSDERVGAKYDSIKGTGTGTGTGTNGMSNNKVKYGVAANVNCLPMFRVKLIGRRNVGPKQVWDITVPGNSINNSDGDNDDTDEYRSFMANGVMVHNCEFPELSVRILHLLGDKGPKTSNPAKYIRFIFNRVILETASVRSAAVSSLAKFGAAVPSLTPSCIVLLKRCLGDNDDEVRDRAIFHLDLLQNDREQANAMLFQRTPFVPFHQLEASLQHYIDKPPSEPFNVSRHLIDVKEVEEKKPEETNTFAKPAGSTTTAAAPAAAASTNDLELFNSIPELKALGKVFKTCAPVELTETETEYVVTCIKHILPNHVVFQFHITNNMEDHQLENVTVEMESENEQWQEELSIPEEKIRSGTPGVAFVVFTRPQNAYQSGSLSCTLKFTVKEVNGDDVSATGSEDEYQLEEMEVTESDFMKPGEAVGLVEFRRQWEALGDTVEVVKKYSLGLDSLQSAVNAVIDLLGMNGVENSTIVPDNVRSHAVNLIGTFYGDVPVLCRAGFMLDANHGVTLKIAVRSQNAALNNMLTSAIR